MPTADTVYVSFSAEIKQVTTEALLSVCSELASKNIKTLYLLFSTPGGNTINGVTLYNTLRGMPFELIAHNVGSVNSIGNIVFLAAEKRYACQNANFMFHGVASNIMSAPTSLSEKDLKERLDAIRADQKRIGSIIAERTTLATTDVAAMFLSAETKNANDAKAAGIIHEIRDVQIPAGAPVKQLVFQR